MTPTTREIIQNWAAAILQQPIVLWQPADMHIDQIDGALRDPAEWTQGGLECFGIARATRTAISPEDAVCLVFYLESTEQKRGLCPAHVRNLASEFDLTPPELVWLRGRQCAEYMSLIAQGLELLNWGVSASAGRVFYYEHNRSSSGQIELSRAVWIISFPEHASPADVRRAKTLPPSTCPRRYCWWWRSLAFEWDISPAEGCTFLTSEKPPNWHNPGRPCKRADPESSTDHFLPRESNLIEDGLLPEWFVRMDD